MQKHWFQLGSNCLILQKPLVLKHIFMRVILFFSLLLMLLTSCNYKRKLTASYISLSPVYASGMVLQTSPGTIIAGKANPGGILAVKISDFISIAQADENGIWQVNFPEIIISEPFSIGFEGKDTSFTFNNIRAGYVYVIAGDGNMPAHYKLQNNRNLPQSSHAFSVFIPPMKGNTQAQQKFSGGKWLPVKEVMKYTKTSQLLFNIKQIIPESDIPIGIIDLSWPGSQIESWLPISGNLELDNQIIEPSFLDSIFSSNEGIQNQILAMKDTCLDGIINGVTRTWYKDEFWKNTELPITIGEKDDFQKKRIVYLRKKIYVSEKHLTSDFYINLGHLHGIANYYFNENEIISQHNSEAKNQLVIPDSLMRIWSNILTIRLFCLDSLTGIYGEDFICHNADSSYYRPINTDWKYSFNLEPEFPLHIPLEQIHGLAYNSLLSPALNVNAESIIFQFSNTTINQTEEFSKKACEIYNALPGSWNMSLAHQALTLSDTLVYGVEASKIDSIFREIEEACEIEIVGI